MKVGDLVEVFYTADSGENAVLTTGLIISGNSILLATIYEYPF